MLILNFIIFALLNVLTLTSASASTATRYEEVVNRDFRNRDRLADPGSDISTTTISTKAPKRGIISSLANRLHQKIKSFVAPTLLYAPNYMPDSTVSKSIPSSSSIEDGSSTGIKTTTTPGIVEKDHPFTKKLTSDQPLNENVTELKTAEHTYVTNTITAVGTTAPVPKPGIINSSFSILLEKLLSLLKDALWFLLRSVPGLVVRKFMFLGICSPSTIFCKVMTTIEASIELFVKINTMSAFGQIQEIIAFILDTWARY